MIDRTKEFTKKEIEDGKVLSLISYIGPLAIVAYLVEKDNKYTIFNAKQGLNLFIWEVIVGVVFSLFGFLLLFLAGLVDWLIGVISFVFMVLGIINVINGTAKELPIINKFKFIKY